MTAIDELWEKYGDHLASLGIDRNLPIPDQLKQVRDMIYGATGIGAALRAAHKGFRLPLLNGEVPLKGRNWQAIIVPKIKRQMIPVLDAEDMLPPELLEQIAPKTTINYINLEPIEKKQRAQADLDALIEKAEVED